MKPDLLVRLQNYLQVVNSHYNQKYVVLWFDSNNLVSYCYGTNSYIPTPREGCHIIHNACAGEPGSDPLDVKADLCNQVANLIAEEPCAMILRKIAELNGKHE